MFPTSPGLIEFIRPLVESGMSVVSTGGTAKALVDAGIPVTNVSDQTGFPEVLDGRVKTLHPKIHMALLARSFVDQDFSTLKKYEIEPFDLVVGNLYLFENAVNQGKQGQELIEFIDIGGPSFLRAAAKSFERITTVVDPSDYGDVLQGLGKTIEGRRRLAAKVFSHTGSYDAMIAESLSQGLSAPHVALGESWFNLSDMGRTLSNKQIGTEPVVLPVEFIRRVFCKVNPSVITIS
ncbi:MAG: hypothetical protein R2827_16560 [Bdellovibrionales bacterium]